MTVGNAFYFEMEQQGAQFTSKEEFNEWKKSVRYQFADKLNESTRNVFDFVSKYAVKNLGVAGLKVPTIAEGVGVSVPTARRALATLEKNSILFRQAFIRPKKGGNGSNLLVFNKDVITFEGAPDTAADRPSDCPIDRPQLIARPQVGTLTAPTVSGTFLDTKTLYSFKTVFQTPLNFLNNLRNYTYNHVATRNKFSNPVNDHLEQPKQNNNVIQIDEEYICERKGIPYMFAIRMHRIGEGFNDTVKAWDRVKIAYYKSGIAEFGISLKDIVAKEDVLKDIDYRVNSVIDLAKEGKIHTDFFGTLYGNMLQMFNGIKEELSAERLRIGIEEKIANGTYVSRVPFYDFTATTTDFRSYETEEYAGTGTLNEEEVIARLLKRAEGRTDNDTHISSTLVPQRDLHASGEELDALGIF